MSILHLEHISYTYEKSETPVLRDITADFEAGKMYAVIGKSGDGKSIRLSLVSGLDVCREGTISYNGENLKCINRDKYRALNIGVVFQSYNLVPVLNVYENIVFPIQLDGNEVDRKYIDSIVKTLGLENRVNALPSQLSGGQQQRVAIARALAAKPAIILADEPTGNLDTSTSQDVLGLLKVTARKFEQTIAMITHNEEIAQMADRIIRIEDGKILKGGSGK